MEDVSRRIYITDYDLFRLRRSLPPQHRVNDSDRPHLHRLHELLDTAVVLNPREIPSHVITMNSRFRLKNLETAAESEYTLVFPGKADISRGLISVLAPAGAALIGAQDLETVSVLTPAGEKQFEISGILYQPEASEDYHL